MVVVNAWDGIRGWARRGLGVNGLAGWFKGYQKGSRRSPSTRGAGTGTGVISTLGTVGTTGIALGAIGAGGVSMRTS